MRHRLHARNRSIMLAATALLVGQSLVLPSQAQATDSSAAAAAVAKLLALPLPGSETAPTTESTKRPTVMTLRGENLDRVIRRALPQQPFKDDFLRKAFVQLNPQLAGKSPARVMPAGTALSVPSQQDLLTLLSEQYPALGKAAAAAREESSASENASTRRRWVQFP